MAILLTNDDGVDAPGLRALAESLAGLDDLYISAPPENRSGVGMGITLGRELTVRFHSDWAGVAVRASIDGTPADATKYGLQHMLADAPPRLVVSGINHGPNLGRNVRCSGTVGAAFEAYLFGIPAMAVSVGYVVTPVWEGAKRYARLVAEKALQLGEKRRDIMLNLNVPALPPQRIKGLRLARHGTGGYQDLLVGTSHNTFSMDGDWIQQDSDDCDATALADDYAVLTPMRFEMTDVELMASLQDEWNDMLISPGAMEKN